MATFILVHGALHGGWCWDRVSTRLEAMGHRALAPDLPGSAGNWMAHQDVSLAVYGDFLADLARRQGERTVLVGHSLAGIAISEAAERVPEAVGGLVYVSGVLLPDGAAAIDLFAGRAMPEGLSLSEDGLSLADDPRHARERYYNGCDDADASSALARLCSQPARPMAEALRLSPDRFGRLARAYVECAHDNAMAPDLQRAQQAALPCDPVFVMQTGHSPFLQAPDELARHLAAAASAFGL
ncbi:MULTISPECIES: alpha/beta fold hydrolase [unclassified Sphingobium]|uniref:alpha/beta fold hydrolase n=1 Tax=unclassified Sphingobium TaxID=2611147 RepID=UPI0035A6B4F7